jgi:hypothetical protein
VTVKAKTTCKRSRQVTKKRWAFKATRGGVTIGADKAVCNIPIDDASLSPEHARVVLSEDGEVLLHGGGRTYYLIGQGARSSGLHPLESGQVVKMGACSLQVVEAVASRREGEGSASAPVRPPRCVRGGLWECRWEASRGGREAAIKQCTWPVMTRTGMHAHHHARPHHATAANPHPTPPLPSQARRHARVHVLHLLR